MADRHFWGFGDLLAKKGFILETLSPRLALINSHYLSSFQIKVIPLSSCSEYTCTMKEKGFH